MRRAHALTASVMVGAAAVAGVVALGKTQELGQSSTSTPDATLAERAAALDRAETQIAELDKSVPPALTKPTAPLTVAAAPVVTVATPARSHDDGEHGDDHGDDHHGSEHEHAESWDD